MNEPKRTVDGYVTMRAEDLQAMFYATVRQAADEAAEKA